MDPKRGAQRNNRNRASVLADMRMLRWVCGVTKMDRIRNERIRALIKGTVKVTEI